MATMTYEEYAASQGFVQNSAGAWTGANTGIGLFGKSRPLSAEQIQTLGTDYNYYRDQQSAIQRGTNPALLVNYNNFSDDPARATGALVRNQYADYMERFRPSEDTLMGMTTYMNPLITGQEIDRAIGGGGYVRAALDVNDANRSYGFQRLGIAQTAEGMLGANTRSGINRSTAVVDAANRIRQRLIDRNQQIATGVVPNAGRAYGLQSEGGE